MSDAKANQFLKSILIDEDSLAAASRDQEQERQVAIFDLLDGNYFEPVESKGGPYDLKLSLIENRLAFDIAGPGVPERRHLLSLSPFRGVIKDYFMICDSYYQAIRTATPDKIEAIDMGRRGIHDEGSRTLQERLAGKVRVDFETSRRLFTLISVLHWKG